MNARETRELRHDRTLLFYEEPQVMVATDSQGRRYVGIRGRHDGTDGCLFSRVQPATLALLERGVADLRNVLTLSALGERFLATDVPVESGTSVATVRFTGELDSSNFLPDAGLVLDNGDPGEQAGWSLGEGDAEAFACKSCGESDAVSEALGPCTWKPADRRRIGAHHCCVCGRRIAESRATSVKLEIRSEDGPWQPLEDPETGSATVRIDGERGEAGQALQAAVERAVRGASMQPGDTLRARKVNAKR